MDDKNIIKDGGQVVHPFMIQETKKKKNNSFVRSNSKIAQMDLKTKIKIQLEEKVKQQILLQQQQKEQDEKERLYRREYSQVFQKLLKQKIDDYLKEELNKMEMGDNIEKQLFQFCHQRIQQIEDYVMIINRAQSKFKSKKSTQLNNAQKDLPSTQKELLKGRYSICMDKDLPFNEKIVRIVQEPVAYQLYKQRHFNEFMRVQKKEDEDLLLKKKDFRKDLIQMANAKIIGKNKFEEIVDNAVHLAVPLSNFIINLPREEEIQMRKRIEQALAKKSNQDRQQQLKNKKFQRTTHFAPLKQINIQNVDEKLKKNNDEKSEDSKSIIDTVRNIQKANQNKDTQAFKIVDQIYKEEAFKNVLYIYEDSKTGQVLTPGQLVQLVMKQIKKDLQHQREELKQESLRKRQQINQKVQLMQQKRKNLNSAFITQDALIENRSKENLNYTIDYEQESVSRERIYSSQNENSSQYQSLRPKSQLGIQFNKRYKKKSLDYGSNNYQNFQNQQRHGSSMETYQSEFKTQDLVYSSLQNSEFLKHMAHNYIMKDKINRSNDQFRLGEIVINNNGYKNYPQYQINRISRNQILQSQRNQNALKEQQSKEEQINTEKQKYNQKLILNRKQVDYKKQIARSMHIEEQKNLFQNYCEMLAPKQKIEKQQANDDDQKTTQDSPLQSKPNITSNIHQTLKVSKQSTVYLENIFQSEEKEIEKKQEQKQVRLGDYQSKKENLRQLKEYSGLQLHKIIKECNKEESKQASTLESIKKDIKELKIWSDVHSKVTSNLKDLDYVNANKIKEVYDYQEYVFLEEQQLAQEFTAEFKRESMDPLRKIVKWERQNQVAKMKKLRQKN